MAELPAEVPRKKRGRKCNVCSLPADQRAAVDSAIVAGEAIERIGRKFSVSSDSVANHRAHIPIAAITEAAEAHDDAEAERGGTLLERASKLLRAAEEMMTEARTEGDRTNAIRAVRECGRLIEISARLTGQIDDSVHLNVLVSPALTALQTTILTALAPFPDARSAVVFALSGIGGAPLQIEHDPG